MALGLIHPLAEKSTRNISWWIKAADAKGWQTYHVHVPIVLKSGNLKLLKPTGPVQACNGIALPLASTENDSIIFITNLPYKIQYYLHNSAKLKHVLN